MLQLHSIGHFHPEAEISNEFLTELDIGTSDEWIVERTGIRSRRTVLPLDYIRETRNADVRAADEAATYSNADISVRAAEMAIERAGVDRSEIGMLIAGGCLPSHALPAEACVIAAALDLDVPAFDIRSACTSFGVALHWLSIMQPDKLPPFVLVVNPETLTRAVDYNDRSSAVLWGDCATAAIVSASQPGRATIETTSFASRPGGYQKVSVPWAGHFSQEGATVQSFAIKRSIRVLSSIQTQLGKTEADQLHFIGHQANLLMLNNVCDHCGITEARHHFNVTRVGNTATAGSPSVLSECWHDFDKGDRVAMVGVGAGLSWTGSLIRFGA